jgi:hypothetical protein
LSDKPCSVNVFNTKAKQALCAPPLPPCSPLRRPNGSWAVCHDESNELYIPANTQIRRLLLTTSYFSVHLVQDGHKRKIGDSRK